MNTQHDKRFNVPKIIISPHKNICPEGATLEATPGETILNVVLRYGIKVEHACGKSCVCTTCHCIVRQGFTSLIKSTEEEDDILDKAWGLEQNSRLSCQAVVANEDLLVEFPLYTINHVHE